MGVIGTTITKTKTTYRSSINGMGKKTSFADEVAELPPTADTRHKTWFDMLPPADKEELLEFRQCWKAGRYQDKTLAQLAIAVQQKYGVQRSRHAIEVWIKSD